MLPPNELKNKEFTRVMRGYSPEEVDEHIDFIIAKYTELYRENDELERRLKTTQSKLDELKKDEESIRTALVNAQRAGSTIINEANERADVVMRAAKTNCDRILAEFRAQIRVERENAVKLRSIVEKFKSDLFNTYNTHIEYIENINTEMEGLDDIKISDDTLTRAAMTAIKNDVTENVEKLEREAAERETARIAAEKEAAEQAAREAVEKEAADKAAREAEEAAAKKAAEEAARIAAEKEAAEKAAAERAAREAAAEKAAREAAEKRPTAIPVSPVKTAQDDTMPPINIKPPMPVIIDEPVEDENEEYEDEDISVGQEADEANEADETDDTDYKTDIESEFDKYFAVGAAIDEHPDEEYEQESGEDNYSDEGSDEDLYSDNTEEEAVRYEDDEPQYDDDEQYDDNEPAPVIDKKGAIPQRIKPVRGSVIEEIANLNTAILSGRADSYKPPRKTAAIAEQPQPRQKPSANTTRRNVPVNASESIGDEEFDGFNPQPKTPSAQVKAVKPHANQPVKRPANNEADAELDDEIYRDLIDSIENAANKKSDADDKKSKSNAKPPKKDEFDFI